MGKPTCPVCGQQYRGIALVSVKDGKEVEVCPACYKTLNAEYRKNSCLACVFFDMGTCGLYGTDLDEPYVQNAKCEFFTTSTDPAVVAQVKERAAASRKKMKAHTSKPLTIDELIVELTERGQTLTYFCCHCGVPLKVGAKNEIQKSCPNCKCDLSVMDMAKLISQHL
jgi:hypothetical protein